MFTSLEPETPLAQAVDAGKLPDFLHETRAIRERGFALDDSENEDGIRCVAVPVRDHTGKMIAAISVSGWSLTMTPDRDEQLAVLAQQTAQMLSERLGSDLTNGEHPSTEN